MKVLVLNSGSSTLKFQLFETAGENVVARGLIDRIGESVADHGAALRLALERLPQPGEIEAVGHRVVHGGEYFREPVIIDQEVVRRIEECIVLAPLHNPLNLQVYQAARELLPAASHVAVFDTAFHQTLPGRAYTYGLPYEISARNKLRRYGFHGTSHRYLALRYAELRGIAPQEARLITCHLGNGCSMCAIEGGRSVDTSMGLTPVEGLLMGTRPGDTDPAAVLEVMKREGLGVEQMDSLLNHHSGLLGISGVSNDMRTLMEHAQRGNVRARLAIDVFCYRIRKYIGAYFAVLNGADAVVFSAGIGEHSPAVRAAACEGLDGLGIRIDAAKNAAAVGIEADISGEGSAVRVWVIPTNEELMICRDTVRAIAARA